MIFPEIEAEILRQARLADAANGGAIVTNLEALQAAAAGASGPSAGDPGQKSARTTAQFMFNPSDVPADRTVGTHLFDPPLPDNAIIISALYEVGVAFHSALDLATIGMGCAVDAPDGIRSAIAINDVSAPYDSGFFTPNFLMFKLTAERQFSVVVGVEPLTVGRLLLVVEYELGIA